MIKDLEAKKAAVEAEFNELEDRKNEIIKRQYELRGKFQAYEEEIVTLDPATTINPKEKK